MSAARDFNLEAWRRETDPIHYKLSKHDSHCVALGTIGFRQPINGYTYRSSVGSVAGKFMLPVSAQVRDGAGVAAGDDVEVDVELYTEQREVAVPADLMAALGQAPDAKWAFDQLPYSHRLRHVTAIERHLAAGAARAGVRIVLVVG